MWLLFFLLFIPISRADITPKYEVCSCQNDYFERYLLNIATPQLASECNISPTPAALKGTLETNNLLKIIHQSYWGYSQQDLDRWQKNFSLACINESLAGAREQQNFYLQLYKTIKGPDNKSKRVPKTDENGNPIKRNYSRYQFCVERKLDAKKQLVSRCGVPGASYSSENLFSGKGDLCSYTPDCTRNPLKNFIINRRPCLSENYVKLIYSTYMQAQECLSNKPIDRFAYINHESTFHANIVSDTLAVGPGQLTRPAIQQVNSMRGKPTYNLPALDMDFYRQLPECQNIKDFLGEKLDADSDCDQLTLPKNPLLNFIYSGVFFKYLQAAAERDALNNYKKYFDPTALPDIAKLLSYWMYNGGSMEVSVLFQRFMDVYSKNNTSKLTANTFYPAFKKFIAQNLNSSDPARRLQVSCFVHKIARDLMDLERRVKSKYNGQVSCAPDEYSQKMLDIIKNDDGSCTS